MSRPVRLRSAPVACSRFAEGRARHLAALCLVQRMIRPRLRLLFLDDQRDAEEAAAAKVYANPRNPRDRSAIEGGRNVYTAQYGRETVY